ncbi:MAG: trypsin-like peptidase domain-containing protein [Verrucomicrobiae bacterium]|nr:trypsin-like peptidase domain-containing protein [Verrucomicrobiae bacterium]
MKKRSQWRTEIWGAVLAGVCAGNAVFAAPAAGKTWAGGEDVRRDPAVIAVETVLPSVVNIATRTWVEREHPYERMLRQYYRQEREPQASYSRGSGVVIDEGGYVLTNTHVVADADDIWVQFFDAAGAESIRAERVVLSQSKDIAVLKLKPSTPRKFKAVRFAANDDLWLGETVLALGNPFGLGGSVARGILSSKSRRPAGSLPAGEPLDIADWLQTDAAINPGNSGGPLINLRGELIGLNVAVFNPNYGQGIGFAIPVRQIHEALGEMLSGEAVGGYWFGGRLNGSERPLVVQSVQPGSPAAVAGLRKGDELWRFNGRVLDSLIAFNEEIGRAGDRQDIALQVRRDGELRTLSLRLLDEKVFFNNDLLRKRLGMTVRGSLGGGLVIDRIEAGGPAAAARLRPGIVIAAADGRRAETLVQFARQTHGKPRGDAMNLSIVLEETFGQYLRRTEGQVEIQVR